MAYADLASTKYVQDYVTAKTPTGDLASLDVVDTNHIVDGAVTTGKIKNSNVTTTKIADGAVTEAKIATDAVTTGKIKNLNVTTAKIADSAVTTGKILDGTIKNADVAADAGIAQSKISGLTSALGGKVNIAQGTGNKGKGLIVNANGNLELANVVTTLTADSTFATQGSYVHDIKVEDGEIKPKSVAFDAVINTDTATGSNAPRTSAVKSYIDQFVVTPSSRLSYITGYTTSADGATITPQVQQFDTEIKDFAGNEDKYNAPTTTAVKNYVDTEVGNVVTTIEGLDLGLVGSAGSYIKTVQQVDGKVTAVSEKFDTVIDDTTGGKDGNGNPKSNNAPTTYAVKTYVDAQIDGVIDGVDDEISSVNSEVAAVKSALNLTGSGSSLTYSLPVATTTTKGAVIVGGNIGVNQQGTISVATANGSTLGVVKAGNNTSISNGAVNVATATPSTLGVVKVGQIPSGSATATNYATIWVE
ncbi:MAG: hypothetical protein IKL14_05370 [Alphaproteobacteria bacterium]|nr:hypothetical protein [Alphaproteobacteria bacterium]